MAISATEGLLSTIHAGMTPGQARGAMARGEKLRKRERKEKQRQFKRKHPREKFRLNKTGDLIIEF